MKHEQKKEIISKYAREKGDTGSPEVQIAILSVRIDSLTEHLKIHKKDNHSRRGLLGLVQKRRRLKNYLQKNNPEAYKKVVDDNNIIKDAKKEAKTESVSKKIAKKSSKKAEAPIEKLEKSVKKTAKKAKK